MVSTLVGQARGLPEAISAPSHIHIWDQSMKDSLYGEPCAYCGLPGQSVDHIPPVTHRDVVPESEWRCVVCCKECNNGLSNRYLLTFADRFQFVKAWLCQRYAATLKCIDRSDGELSEFGPTLRRKLKSAITKKARIIERLTYAAPPVFLPYYKDRRF